MQYHPENFYSRCQSRLFMINRQVTAYKEMLEQRETYNSDDQLEILHQNLDRIYRCIIGDTISPDYYSEFRQELIYHMGHRMFNLRRK